MLNVEHIYTTIPGSTLLVAKMVMQVAKFDPLFCVFLMTAVWRYAISWCISLPISLLFMNTFSSELQVRLPMRLNGFCWGNLSMSGLTHFAILGRYKSHHYQWYLQVVLGRYHYHSLDPICWSHMLRWQDTNSERKLDVRKSIEHYEIIYRWTSTLLSLIVLNMVPISPSCSLM